MVLKKRKMAIARSPRRKQYTVKNKKRKPSRNVVGHRGELKKR